MLSDLSKGQVKNGGFDNSRMAKRIVDEYDPSAREKKPRIVVTGCPMGGATEKVIKAIEDNGGVIVAFENCSGEKNFDRNVDLEAEDLVKALADRYIDIGCSVMSPDVNRFELLGRLIDEYKACRDCSIDVKKIE